MWFFVFFFSFENRVAIRTIQPSSHMPQPKRFYIMTNVFVTAVILCAAHQYTNKCESFFLFTTFHFAQTHTHTLTHTYTRMRKKNRDMNLSDHLFVILTLNTSSLHWFTSLCFCVCSWTVRKREREKRTNAYVCVYVYGNHNVAEIEHIQWKRMKSTGAYISYFSRLHEL